MQHNLTLLSSGQVYSGFTVISVIDIPESKGQGIHLRHNKTGLEVFHIYNDDEENLFSFAFKTLPDNSKGAAHILEHSVLCGSAHYPLKDPFIQLANQSVKTFLNAMTFSDKTVYPASSMVEADYFNLMSVYGDAVFFPLLDSHIFSQEAHRLEVDENNNLSIQGVVYNEMKGNYSSFENVVGDYALQTILPNTPYAFDSGGDPSVIPELTHRELKDFHSKFYHPSNCKMFLYGNIPTEKQLNFISEKFLSHFPDFAKQEDSISISLPDFPPPTLYDKPQYIQKAGPAGEDTKSTVLVSWLLGDSSDPVQYLEDAFMCEMLLGHDGSPLTQALIECGLGEDVAPASGIDSEMRYITMSVGLRGVDQKNALKVENVILQVIKSLCDNGIPEQHIKSAILSVDFMNREVKRGSGPYSLVLMRRSLRGWIYGKSPDACLSNRKAFEQVKQRIKNDPSYVVSLLRRLLLNNNHRVCLTVYPDDLYLKQVAQNEKDMIDLLSKRLASDVITGGKPVFNDEKNNQNSFSSNELVIKLAKNLQQELIHFQQTPDDPELVSRIPHVKTSDLSIKIDRIETECTNIDDVPVFISNEPTNGITYIEACFPVDVLQPEDFMFLPFFATSITNIGFSGMSWAESSAKIALLTGGFGASLFTSSAVPLSAISNYEIDSNLVGRSWIFFRIKMLNELTCDAIELLFDCIKNADFSDFKRLKDLAIEYKNDLDASIIPAGNDYIASRATCCFTRSKAIDEIWNGLSSLYFVHSLLDIPPENLQKTFNRIRSTILDAGLIFHVTADDDGKKSALESLSSQIKKNAFHKPIKKADVDDNEFYKLTFLNESTKQSATDDCKCVAYNTKTQVGFASVAFNSSPFGTDELVYESLFAHLLTNSALWEQIRTIGGAYGAFAFADGLEQTFLFVTFRDPKPFESIKTYNKCLHNASQTKIDKNALEKAITGCYSKEIQPRSPFNRGFAGFIRKLYGLTADMQEHKIQILIAASEEDILRAAKRLLQKESECSCAVLCEIDKKNKEKASLIVNLPL